MNFTFKTDATGKRLVENGEYTIKGGTAGAWWHVRVDAIDTWTAAFQENWAMREEHVTDLFQEDQRRQAEAAGFFNVNDFTSWKMSRQLRDSLVAIDAEMATVADAAIGKTSQPVTTKQLSVHEQIARDKMKPVAVETTTATTATAAKPPVLWMPPVHEAATPVDHWGSTVAKFMPKVHPAGADDNKAKTAAVASGTPGLWGRVVARYNGHPQSNVPKGWEQTVADAQVRVALERGEKPKLSHGWDQVVARFTHENAPA